MHTATAGRAVLLLLLAFTCYLVYLLTQPFLPGLAWGIVMAVVLFPVYQRLLPRVGGRHWVAGGILTALVAAFVVVPMALAVVQIAAGLSHAVPWLSQRVSEGYFDAARIAELPGIGPAWLWVRDKVGADALDLPSMALSALRAVGSAAAGQAGALATNALQAFLTAGVLLVTLFVLLREGPSLIGILRDLLPLSSRDRDEVLNLLRDVIRSVFLGVFGTAFVQGVLGSIGFALVGIPQVVMFGAAMMLASLIPGGTALVWGPVGIWLLLSGSTGKGIFLLLWGAVVVSSSDNVVRPLLIGRGVKIPMVLVFLGTLGGLMAWGLIGLFVGPLLIAVSRFLLEVVRRDLFRPEPEPATPGSETAP